VFVLRDQVLPLYRLREVVGLGGRDPDGTQVVIVEASDRKAALVVDRLEGQDDIVVKTFDAVRGMIPGIAGATVLPDGRTAMIMDAGGIL
jgi:two-component system chemotaxis sensor kinase CheA